MTVFGSSEIEQLIRSSVRDIVDDYDRSYWREARDRRQVPEAVWQHLADNDWLGVMYPEEYGGQGMGIQELVAVMEEVAAGGGWSALPYFTITIVLGGHALLKHGSEEQKSTWIPKIARGETQWATGITEPDVGLNTTNIQTAAQREGDEYVLDGHKAFISGVAAADRMTVLTRTLSDEESESRGHGFSLFIVDPEDPNVSYDEIELEIYANRVYNVYFDDVRVPESNLVGEEHQGLYHLFDGINAERISAATAAYGMGRTALDQAAEYAKDRVVFDQPIGAHQAIQHPLADAHADLETARVMNHRAAWSFDNGEEDLPAVANIAKLNAAKAAWNATEAAVSTFGGTGATAEVDVTKLWSRVRHYRYSPVSEEMIRNYLAENELGLPRSY